MTPSSPPRSPTFNQRHLGWLCGVHHGGPIPEAFVERAQAWAHFDIYGWCPTGRPHCPVGGEAQGIRALFDVLEARYRR